MIQGIEIEIVDIEQFRDAALDTGNKSNHVFFTPAEIYYCKSKVNSQQNYAARYAAKIALFRSLNLNETDHSNWHGVEILNNEQGKPELHFSNHLKSILESKKIEKVHLSLSHVKHAAIATIILED